MRHIAVIGSGPAGYYTAEACQKQFGEDVRVDIIDRLPVLFGLIRTGVAPDHQSIKSVSRRYEAVAIIENVRFVGNVTVGKDVTIPVLMQLHDAVELATAFHLFYQQCRVVSSAPEDIDVTRARLRLVEAARVVLARCLSLMLMAAPDDM